MKILPHLTLVMIVLFSGSAIGCRPIDQQTTASGTTEAASPDDTSPSQEHLTGIKLSYWKQTAAGAPDSELSFSIGITNDSNILIQQSGPESLQVLATWHDPTSYALVAASKMTPLTSSIPAHNTSSADVKVLAPAKPGNYLLKIQLADSNGQPLEGKGVVALQYNISIE